MITFIPSWGENVFGSASMDDLISQMRSFINSSNEYQILVIDYMPSQRYFLHEYDLLESEHFNIFDELQGFSGDFQKNLNISDLYLGEDVSYVYTPFNVLVMLDNKIKDIVEFGISGHIYKVNHMVDGKKQVVDVYDDRGILSSQEVFYDDKKVGVSYVDINGKWILTENCDNNEVIVNPDNPHGLKYFRYQNMNEVKIELLNSKLKNISKYDSVVMSVNEKLLPVIERFSFLDHTTLSFFKDRISDYKRNEDLLLSLFTHIKGAIVDTEVNFEKLTNIVSYLENIYILVPYDTRFELSVTQEIKEEIIYIDIKNVENIKSEKILFKLLDYIFDEYKNKQNGRSFELFLRVNKTDSEIYLQNKIDEYLENKFDGVITGLEYIKNNIEKNKLDEYLIKEENYELALAWKIKKSLNILNIRNDFDLFTIIGKARLIIDFNDLPDLFTQMAGISAGLPQINVKKTMLIDDLENGVILDDLDRLPDYLKYYLDSLNNWQTARSYAVTKIKKFSGESLKNKLLRIVGEI